MKKLKLFIEKNYWVSNWYSRDNNWNITSKSGNYNLWTKDFYLELWEVLKEIYNEFEKNK